MTKDKWMNEARRWARHAYCYAEMVDEFDDHFEALFEAGSDPYGAVDEFGERHGLERCDLSSTWGINSGKEFVREV